MRDDIPAGSRLVLIPYCRVFHPQVGLDAYAQRLARSLPRGAAIERLGELAALHYDDSGGKGPSEQRRRLDMTGPLGAAPWIEGVEKMIDGGGVLIHAHGVAMATRLLLLHGVERKSDETFGATIVKLMLVINELFGAHQGLVGPDTSDEQLVDVELLGAIIPEGDTTSAIPRQFTFLKWADGTSRENLDNWIDVRADFTRLLGLTPEEYLAGAATFVMHLLGATGRLDWRTSAVVRISELERAFNRPERLRAWITRFVAPLEAVRADLLARDHDYSSASLVPFLLHPLVNVDGDAIVCPLPATLDNTLGAGFYFALYDAYNRNGEASRARRFSAMYGRFFEEHVGTLLEKIVDPAAESVSRELTYRTARGEFRTSDFFVLDGARRLVVIEAAKTRLNFQSTLIQRDRESLVADIRRIVVANVRQVSRTLRDLRAGLFPFPCSREELSGVHALIVAGQRIPGLYGVNGIVERVLREEGGLGECSSVHVTDIEELEILAAAHDHNLRLCEMMEAKAQSADCYERACRLQSFIERHAPTARSERRIVSPDFDAFFEELVMPTLSAWGIRG